LAEIRSVTSESEIKRRKKEEEKP